MSLGIASFWRSYLLSDLSKNAYVMLWYENQRKVISCKAHPGKQLTTYCKKVNKAFSYTLRNLHVVWSCFGLAGRGKNITLEIRRSIYCCRGCTSELCYHMWYNHCHLLYSSLPGGTAKECSPSPVSQRRCIIDTFESSLSFILCVPSITEFPPWEVSLTFTLSLPSRPC